MANPHSNRRAQRRAAAHDYNDDHPRKQVAEDTCKEHNVFCCPQCFDMTPVVAVGAGEGLPWAYLDLCCPTCGEGPLELHDSEPPGLTYIKHCGGIWLRGPINL